eukprot:GAHX01000986.1.p1 GENE.GAHX01000986.1~~GAHX01000986.1.p1  ORF type:complete len:411 (+),score=47.66 GAHX01000986.1:820-2052(+)
MLVFFILVGVDSNRKTVMFGWFLLANESYRLLSKAFREFLENNDSNINKFYITDKDLSERKVLLELFPQSKRFLCRFHVLKFFKNYLRKTKFNLSKEVYQENIMIIKKIIYAKTDLEYIFLRDSLAETVKEFYMENWDSCKEEFVEHFKEDEMYLNIHTTNNAESYFSSLKRFIKLKNDMAKFINEIVEFTRYKRNVRLRENLHDKNRVKRLSYITPFDNLKGSLSHFSFTVMLNAYKTALEYQPENYRNLTMLSTCCKLRKQYLLPCKHVMHYLLNNDNGDNWGDLERFIHNRWYLENNMNKLFNEINQKEITLSSMRQKEDTTSIHVSQQTNSKISELQKFKKLRHITDRLASTLSQENDIEFTMKLMEYMVRCVDSEDLREFSNRFDIQYIPNNKKIQNQISKSITK